MSSILQQADRKTGDRAFALIPIIMTILRLVVGILFTATGVAKLFILSDFSNSVRQVLSLAPSVATGIALIVISLEFLGGMALLLNKFIRVGTVVLLCLTVIFCYILAIEIIAQHKFVCHCFGVLPIALSNSNELILNFILLDMLLLLYRPQNRLEQNSGKGWNWRLIIMGALLLYSQYTTAAYIIDRDLTDNPVNIQKINNFISNHYGPAMFGLNSHHHVVLLRVSDFGCPPCFYDFVAYSKTITQYYDRALDGNKVIGLVEQSGAITDTVMLNAWKNANDIQFPLLLVPASRFKEFDFFKSCVVYQWPHGKIRLTYTFPGRESDRKKLMTAFTQ